MARTPENMCMADGYKCPNTGRIAVRRPDGAYVLIADGMWISNCGRNHADFVKYGWIPQDIELRPFPEPHAG